MDMDQVNRSPEIHRRALMMKFRLYAAYRAGTSLHSNARKCELESHITAGFESENNMTDGVKRSYECLLLITTVVVSRRGQARHVVYPRQFT